MWLPEGYELKTGEKDAYTSIPEGTTTLRILSKPIVGYVAWQDKKPVRHRTLEEFQSGTYEKKPVPFWAMVVYNYELKRIQVWELTKITLMKKLKAYTDNAKWGDPTKYDIQVSRKGTTMETTEYELIAEPKEPVSEEIKKEYFATPVILEKLFNGDSPFEMEQTERETRREIDKVLDTAQAMNLNLQEVNKKSKETYDDDLPF